MEGVRLLATNTDGADVFLQTSVDSDSVYVQQQVLLTLRLYYRIGLSSYDADDLSLNNTTVAEVSENTFQTQVSGKTYNVFEKVYALHPQSSGELKIPRQSWRLEKSLRSFRLGRTGNPYIYIKSDPLNIKVNAIPERFTGIHWLPSTAVTIE